MDNLSGKDTKSGAIYFEGVNADSVTAFAEVSLANNEFKKCAGKQSGGLLINLNSYFKVNLVNNKFSENTFTDKYNQLSFDSGIASDIAIIDNKPQFDDKGSYLPNV